MLFFLKLPLHLKQQYLKQNIGNFMILGLLVTEAWLDI